MEMTPRDLLRAACTALLDGGIEARVTLAFLPGTRPMPGFPRGELMISNARGRVYSYPAARLVAWVYQATRP